MVPTKKDDDKQNAPISLRLGDLATEVDRRRGSETASGIIRRDLKRYYEACEAALRRFSFDYFEARTLVDQLSYTKLDGEAARFVWAELDEKIRRSKWHAENKDDYDRAMALVEQLRGMTVFEGLAIIDAIDIYNRTYHENGHDVDAALDVARLTRELPDDYWDAAFEKWSEDQKSKQSASSDTQ
ncbi:MAG: hypothetical protein ACT4P8_10260 [Betaproteobacteria bacterium]